MTGILNVLIVEDSPSDAAMVARLLRKADYDVRDCRVDTADQMRSALDRQSWDIIISDHALPQFNAQTALTLLHETGLDIPFIIVSGAIGEETAVECMRAGAQDYVSKSNLSRLVPAVGRELREAALRKENKKTAALLDESEKKFAHVFQNAPVPMAIARVDDGQLLEINEQYLRITEFSREELIGHSVTDLNLWVKPEERSEMIKTIMQTKTVNNHPIAIRTKSGKIIDLLFSADLVDIEGILCMISSAVDITERKQSLDKLHKALQGTVQAIASVVEARDPYTAGHERRVAALASLIATGMDLSADQVEGLRMAALIHDIGKISVPAEILIKPTKLSDNEFNLIKTHAQSGYDLLKDIEFPWPIARMVLEHHERIDGSGYPNGLAGENVLLESKILAVADAVEAIASDRPYRPARGIEVAIAEIKKNKGTTYDAVVVDCCLRLLQDKASNSKIFDYPSAIL